MGYKLERLLSRPSSLQLLRFLVGGTIPAVCHAQRRKCCHGTITNHILRRAYTGQPAAKPDNVVLPNALEGAKRTSTTTPDINNSDHRQSTALPTSIESSKRTSPRPATIVVRKKVYGAWEDHPWSRDELEFESDLRRHSVDGTPRLLDSDWHKFDMQLWGYLFDYRKRVYGHEGILMFFDVMSKEDILVPTTGYIADKFWLAFLDLGFQRQEVLYRVVNYADYISRMEGRRWPKLYEHVLKFFLLKGTHEDAVKWHNRLHSNHFPSPLHFAELCRYVIRHDGDHKALQFIYLKNRHRSLYSKVVPLLCQMQNFEAAANWHHFLADNGDLPANTKLAEPLIHHLNVHEPASAATVRTSLSGIDPTKQRDNYDDTLLSREMVNRIHGEMYNIKAKIYDDDLGARWFATRWVSLDIALTVVNALGIEEIGPLSLQAIALRDPDPKRVSLRITELQNLGISIGKSLYSRCIEDFAKRGDVENLQGLLNSDQHPDTLEDRALQMQLLWSFQKNGDWVQYRRTRKILSLDNVIPLTEIWNFKLCEQITSDSKEDVKWILEVMRELGVPVSKRTIGYLVRHTLSDRRRGRRPMTNPGTRNRGNHNDINVVVSYLKYIIESGNHVPPICWREVIRRLGMLGRHDDLQALALYLADHSPFHEPIPNLLDSGNQASGHPLHPWRILFGPSFQRAVIEWGFIHGLRRERSRASSLARSPFAAVRHSRTRSSSSRVLQRWAPFDTSSLPNLTSGLVLLKTLSQRGVYIHGPSVRKALLDRLVTYFGPGMSDKKYNRLAQVRLQRQLHQVVQQIDYQLGGSYFARLDLPQVIEALGRKRLLSRQLRKERRARKVDTSADRNWHSQMW